MIVTGQDPDLSRTWLPPATVHLLNSSPRNLRRRKRGKESSNEGPSPVLRPAWKELAIHWDSFNQLWGILEKPPGETRPHGSESRLFRTDRAELHY